jgi:hypothetical protein
METPNPENLVVATSGFYMDPSHLRPIPPMLLEFAVEFSGFERFKVVRLQESQHLHEATQIELINVLNGVSPDYSVVAQKSGEPEQMAAFDAVFGTSFGLELPALAQRYETWQAQARNKADARMNQLGEQIKAAELNASGLFQRTLETIGAAQAATQSALLELQNAKQREHDLEAALHSRVVSDLEARAALYLNQAQEARATISELEARAALYLNQAQEAAERAMQAERHIAQAEQDAAEAEQRIVDAEERIAEAEERIADAERRTSEAEQRTSEAEQRATQDGHWQNVHAEAERNVEHVQWQLNEMTVRATRAEQKVAELYASSSWRITRPARAAMTLMRRPREAAEVTRLVAAGQKARARNMLMPLVRNLARRPRARAFALRALAHFPALEGRLRNMAYRALNPAPVPQQADAAHAPVFAAGGPDHKAPPAHLSPSAQRIFSQLQTRSNDDHNEQ